MCTLSSFSQKERLEIRVLYGLGWKMEKTYAINKGSLAENLFLNLVLTDLIDIADLLATSSPGDKERLETMQSFKRKFTKGKEGLTDDELMHLFNKSFEGFIKTYAAEA